VFSRHPRQKRRGTGFKPGSVGPLRVERRLFRGRPAEKRHELMFGRASLDAPDGTKLAQSVRRQPGI
jgi:hypothetical protein